MWWTRSSIPPSALGLVSGSRAGWERRPPPPRRRHGHRGISHTYKVEPAVQGTSHVHESLCVCSRVCVVRGTGPFSLIDARVRAKRRGEFHARRDAHTSATQLTELTRSVLRPPDGHYLSWSRRVALGRSAMGAQRQLYIILYIFYIHLNSTIHGYSVRGKRCILTSYPINTIRLPLHSVETLWSPFNNPFRPCARDRLQLDRRARSQARRARWPRT